MDPSTLGALLSAILSTASGALLAPSSLFTENVLRPLTKHLSDKQVLWTVRLDCCSFRWPLLWLQSFLKWTMYKMVQNAYKVTLVGAFVPLAFGVLWKRATTQGAALSILFGFGWSGFLSKSSIGMPIPVRLYLSNCMASRPPFLEC